MIIHCENCGAQISNEDISLKMGVAQCSNCDSLFRLDEIIKENKVVFVEREKTKKRIEAQPKGIEITRNHNYLSISRKWFSPKIFALLFFCIFWDGFMIAWYGIAIYQKIWIMGIFGLLHLAVGVFLTYYTLCGFFNKTVIKATSGWLIIKSGPLPVTGNCEIPVAEIDQLYCKRKRQQNKNSVSYTYSLEMIKNDGKGKTLIQTLDDYEQARFLEQEIEDFLGIEDRKVEEEHISE